MKAYLRIPCVIVVGFATVTLAIAAVVAGGYYYVAPSLPSAEELRNVKIQIPLQVYSRDGRLIQEFGEVHRTPVAYDHIPPLLVKAILAAEDERFFEHPGVDYRGVLRAILNEVMAGDRSVGGSTITQQVTRTLSLLSRERNYVRKFKEWILAFRLEREFTKQEILALYLNTYFFGQGSYGVVTAAQTYFGKDLDQLTVSEIAILAGIPQAPSILNPISSPERATARRSYVLRRMRETGAIDESQYATALAEPVIGKRYGLQTQLDAPYVAEMVRAEMIRRFGPAAYTAGLKVTTTVDSRLQEAANRAIHNTLTAYDERHGYRGPLAHVALPESGAFDEAALRTVLDDYPPVLDFEAAVVLAVEPQTARVVFAGRGEQVISFDAVAWAARYVNDDATGPRPKTMTEVLAPGDIVRFRLDADKHWRLAQIPEAQGAFVSVDPLDGAVVALTGGYDFFLSKYNRATQAKRQPGSSFKPFIYSAALAHGFTPATIVNDAPPDVGYQPALERVWHPENFGGKYFGETRLRVALQKSLNAVSIRILQKMGVPDATAYVRRFGFDDVAVPNNLSLALGAGGVAPLDLANGYATFANGGLHVESYFVQRVADSTGQVIYEAHPKFCAECNTPQPTLDAQADAPPAAGDELVTDVAALYPRRVAERIISPQNAYLMTDMLQDVVRIGTGAAAGRALERTDLSGKTGTTNDGRDTWFVGFNADIVAAAWVGFDQDRPLGGNEQGGVTAIPMWIEYMRTALEGRPPHALQRPPGIVDYRINPDNGLIANDSTPNSIFEKFEIDNVPERDPEPAFAPGSAATGPGTRVRPGEPIF
jgi:penicillin-binding protein 1A